MSHVFQCNTSPSKVERLKDRSEMLKKARLFFDQRGVLEVDCPILSKFAAIDAHIDLIEGKYLSLEDVYLHSSPEFGMKRLLAEGMGDIYQLSHVFRDGEWGFKHNPEFMMAEWYRKGMSLDELIQETIDFISLFLGSLPYQTITYRELFQKYTGIDYVKASEIELMSFIETHKIKCYPTIREEGKDALLNLILGSEIEPKLGSDHFLVLAYYPSSQAALARRKQLGDEEVAERFEIYYKGVELANGYRELTCAHEQRIRFEEANEWRATHGKKRLPIDENFLSALEKGLPDCSGVAVGFDRLMMLRHNVQNISEILTWGWSES